MTARWAILPVALAAASLPAPLSGVVRAQVQDEVTLDGGTQGIEGRLAINIAAGNGNQQINGAALAQGDIASTAGEVHQDMADAPLADRATRLVLGDDAFANIQGIASINVAAGAQNQSANLAALALGDHGAISDIVLSQTRAPSEPSGLTGDAEIGNDFVAVSDDAFRDSSGLIQVNLIGGERNSSANTFALNVSGEVSP